MLCLVQVCSEVSVNKYVSSDYLEIRYHAQRSLYNKHYPLIVGYAALLAGLLKSRDHYK